MKIKVNDKKEIFNEISMKNSLCHSIRINMACVVYKTIMNYQDNCWLQTLMLKGKRQKWTSMLSMSSSTTTSTCNNVAKRTYNTTKLTTRSVRLLLCRMLLPSTFRCSTKRLSSTTSRTGRWNSRHCCRLTQNQWWYSAISTGKSTNLSSNYYCKLYMHYI